MRTGVKFEKKMGRPFLYIRYENMTIRQKNSSGFLLTYRDEVFFSFLFLSMGYIQWRSHEFFKTWASRGSPCFAWTWRYFSVMVVVKLHRDYHVVSPANPDNCPGWRDGKSVPGYTPNTACIFVNWCRSNLLLYFLKHYRCMCVDWRLKIWRKKIIFAD